jgi:hypothetical protein
MLKHAVAKNARGKTVFHLICMQDRN